MGEQNIVVHSGMHRIGSIPGGGNQIYIKDPPTGWIVNAR